MLTKWEITEIVDFTKTNTWGLFKKLFKEKKDWVLDFMWKLDVDDVEQRKTYKKMKSNLDAFDSLIIEIENLEKSRNVEENIEKYNKDVDDFINWNDEKEEKIDN